MPGRPELEIHRSPRRRRSAQANPRDGVVVVRLPAGLAVADEERMIEGLVQRVTRRVRADALGGDAALAARADALADRYLDGVRATSVAWSARMERRYGSCSPGEGRVRISTQLAGHPPYVIDAVLLHELAHLQIADHSAAFWALVERFPEAARARGFLEGFAAGRFAAGIPGDPGATLAAGPGGQPPVGPDESPSS